MLPSDDKIDKDSSEVDPVKKQQIPVETRRIQWPGCSFASKIDRGLYSMELVKVKCQAEGHYVTLLVETGSQVSLITTILW